MNLFILAYANDTSAYVPAEWAQESLAILEENMVAARLVHRDFEELIANWGDTVNTRRPGQFTALRKTDNDSVTDQDATATNVQVVLDQFFHVTFIIKDGQQSKSFKNLVEEYLAPAMLGHARAIDRVVLGQYPRFITNCAGHLNTAAGRNDILDTRLIMNNNKAYENGRNLVLTPATESDLLKLDLFTQAQQVGDDGSALREASLGRKLGYNTYMCQNMSTVATGNDNTTGAINNAAGYPIGTTAITIDGFSAAIGTNSWVTIAGDDVPQRVMSSTGGATPTALVISPGLKHAVVDNAVVTAYTPGQINLVAGYAAGYNKTIVYDTFTVDPKVGQFLTFTTTNTSAIYTIIAVDTTAKTITLDRSLTVALADNDKINLGPPGNYNFAFHKDAIALVTRPLALPDGGMGARAAVVNYNGLSIRVVMTYDGVAQGTRVTLDLLCGVQVLDTNLGAVLCG